MEADGFIYTVPGKGCYVSPRNSVLIREDSLKKIEDHIEQIAQLAAIGNISKEEIIEMIYFSLEEYR